MITIKTFNSRIEAELAKSFLESENISCMIQSDDEGGMSPGLAFLAGARLMVHQDDLETAQKLLK